MVGLDDIRVIGSLTSVYTPSPYLLVMNDEIDLEYSLCLDGDGTLGLIVHVIHIWVVDSIGRLGDIQSTWFLYISSIPSDYLLPMNDEKDL